MRIGILALQGAFLEHKNILDILGIENIYVKTKQDLENIDGIILPGGESTAMGKLLRDFDILNILKEKVERGFPVFGTCSGMIFLAKELINDETKHLSTMNISVKRNVYGRQLGSFRTYENFKGIDRKVGEGVEILAKVDDKIVAVREKNMLAISFHPELTKDLSVHKYFLKMVKTFLPKV